MSIPSVVSAGASRARPDAVRVAAPWRLGTIMAAPHRLGFLAAALVMSASAIWWCVELILRQLGAGSLAVAVPASFVHAVLMTYGFMPLFFSGFLFTAGPRWLQMPEGEANTIRPGVMALLMGWCAWLIGARWHAGVAALGAVLAAIGWGWLAVHFSRLVRQSPARDKVHGTVVMVASWVGVAGLLLTAAGVALGRFDCLRWATWLGLWWFVVPVYVAVAHRMIPFFTAAVVPALDAWRPNWLLWSMLAAAGLQGLWFVLDAVGLDGTGWSVVRAFSSIVIGALLLALAVRWGLVQSLSVRLLAMLHIGFMWLGITFLLDGANAIQQVMGLTTASHLAALHALTMGFLGSVLIAMATRVSCGHGGRTLAADNIAWSLFWLVQLAVVLRVASAWWGAHAGVGLLAASGVWTTAVVGWSVRYGRWFGRPRLDGRPG
ncbi:NnrS family protein [Aquabacterium sp.]|uniref:NnrS family protein n=1 Tax=Aquabacterium sp. TaxID=1872578 RepID=UPI0035AD8347